MQEWISTQDSVKNMPLALWTRHSLFWLTVLQQQCRHSTPRSRQRLSSFQDNAQLWRHLNSVTPNLPALVTHMDSGQSSWPPYTTIKTSHLQCRFEMWIGPLVQSSCALIKEHWVKIHPEINTYSQCRNSSRAWYGSEERGWDLRQQKGWVYSYPLPTKLSVLHANGFI